MSLGDPLPEIELPVQFDDNTGDCFNLDEQPVECPPMADLKSVSLDLEVVDGLPFLIATMETVAEFPLNRFSEYTYFEVNTRVENDGFYTSDFYLIFPNDAGGAWTIRRELSDIDDNINIVAVPSGLTFSSEGNVATLRMPLNMGTPRSAVFFSVGALTERDGQLFSFDTIRDDVSNTRPLMYFIPAVEDSADVLPLVSMPQYSDPAALVRSFALIHFPFNPPDPFEVPSTLLDVDRATQHDFGDAPNGAPSDYVNGALTGLFPNSPANGGPEHELSGRFWLGESVTGEANPVLGADVADDGVLGMEVAACETSTLYLMVNLSGLSAAERAEPLFVNLFADWNRDGPWQGTDNCADEWALQNHPLDLNAWDPNTPLILEAPQFTAGEQVKEFWYRFTLSATEIEEIATTFPSGETEDYLYTSDTLLAAITGGGLAAPFLAPLPSEPSFSCPGGIIPPGEWESSFLISQTSSSRSFRVTDIASADILEVKPPTHGMDVPSVADHSIEAGLLGDGRMSFDLRINLVHAEDDSKRMEGPFSVILAINGTFAGRRGGAFDQVLACPYYVEHTGLLGASWIEGVHGTFVGAPQGLSGLRGGPASDESDARFFEPNGKTFTVQSPIRANQVGEYDPATLRLFSSALTLATGAEAARTECEGADRKIEFENGVQVRVPSQGRGLRITTQRADMPRVEVLTFAIGGENGAGEPITDFYRFLIGHCDSERVAAGLFKPAFDGDDESCPLPRDPSNANEGKIFMEGSPLIADCGVMIPAQFTGAPPENTQNSYLWLFLKPQKQEEEDDAPEFAATPTAQPYVGGYGGYGDASTEQNGGCAYTSFRDQKTGVTYSETSDRPEFAKVDQESPTESTDNPSQVEAQEPRFVVDLNLQGIDPDPALISEVPATETEPEETGIDFSKPELENPLVFFPVPDEFRDLLLPCLGGVGGLTLIGVALLVARRQRAKAADAASSQVPDDDRLDDKDAN